MDLADKYTYFGWGMLKSELNKHLPSPKVRLIKCTKFGEDRFLRKGMRKVPHPF
jgi:hypothetical protein